MWQGRCVHEISKDIVYLNKMLMIPPMDMPTGMREVSQWSTLDEGLSIDNQWLLRESQTVSSGDEPLIGSSNPSGHPYTHILTRYTNWTQLGGCTHACMYRSMHMHARAHD